MRQHRQHGDVILLLLIVGDKHSAHADRGQFPFSHVLPPAGPSEPPAGWGRNARPHKFSSSPKMLPNGTTLENPNCPKNYHCGGSLEPLAIALRRSQNIGMRAFFKHFLAAVMILKPSSAGCSSSTSPNAKHRVRLEPKTVPNRTESAGISATYVAPTIGYDDDDEEPVELPPEQEAGVQTAMKHLRDDKVRRAINVLCGLPTKMARDMTKHDREVSLKGATNYFENLIVDNLRYAFTLPRRKDNAR